LKEEKGQPVEIVPTALFDYTRLNIGNTNLPIGSSFAAIQ